MYVQGNGRPLQKKGDKFDSAVAENEKLLAALLNKRTVKDSYTTVNVATLSSITLDTHPLFVMLKSEIENFNGEVRKALETKSELPDYNWKYSLHLGLRNLLKDIVSTEDKSLKVAFLERAKQWFYDKMIKKGTMTEEKLSTRPDTTQSTARPITALTNEARPITAITADTRPITAMTSGTRPFTAATRPFTALTRPFTSRTGEIPELNQTYGNMSIIPPENESVQGKSFFDNTQEMLPSKLRAEILKDYEEGARTKHDIVEPPYERIMEYERKMPLGILKPPSRVGQRPQTGKTTSFAQTREPVRPVLDKGMTIATVMDGEAGDEEEPEAEGSQAGEEGQPGDVDAPPPKAGIVVPARRLYLDDKTTGFEQTVKDMNIPMEHRSNYANYVPSNTAPESNLEQIWRDAMNKKVIERREKEEFVTKMKEWSQKKSRLEEEISRRNESNTFGSRFQIRTFVPRAKSAHVFSGVSRKETKEIQENGEEDLDIQDVEEISEKSQEHDGEQSGGEEEEGVPKVYRETGTKKVGQPEFYDFSNIRPKSVATGLPVNPVEFEPVEDKVNKLKIERIKRLHSALVFAPRNVDANVVKDETYTTVERPTSLSVYDQNKLQKYRPFSAVYQSAKPEVFRHSQMEGIEEVKAKLAKFRIKVPAQQLKTALLLPELPTGNHPKLPEPGLGLMKNPFFKEKKGKKKGKKGGKKKK